MRELATVLDPAPAVVLARDVAAGCIADHARGHEGRRCASATGECRGLTEALLRRTGRFVAKSNGNCTLQPVLEGSFAG